MECEEVLLRLWEYLDRELGPEEARNIGEHVYSCLKCGSAYRCDRAFLDLLARQRTSCQTPPWLMVWTHTSFGART